MARSLGAPLLVSNPAAGTGKDGVLARLQRGLREAGIDHDVAVTTRAGEATEITAAAVDAGRDYVVAVGGDGTVHEVVNGLVDAEHGRPRREGVVLGVVSAGSGSDFARTFGLDRPVERLLPHLRGDATMRVDLGRVRVSTEDGSERAYVFANVADVGFGAEVAAVARRLPRKLGPGRYVAGIVVGWGRFRRVETTVTVDGALRTERVCNVVVANGQFFGGGLHVAPRAIPNDGKFCVQSWIGSPTDVLRAPRQLRTGAHLQRPDVRSWTSASAKVEAVRRLRVEADGEILGFTPARFDVLEGVLELKL